MALIDHVENLTIRNSTLVTADDPDSLIIGWYHKGDPKMYTAMIRQEYTGENNTFGSPAGRDVFEITESYDEPRWVDLQTWQRYTGTDTGSRWVSFESGSR